jgi:hypothetical protein
MLLQEWAAKKRYMRLAQTRRGALARAATPRLNYILTYDKFGPQYACKLANNARITMDWAVKELKQRLAENKSINGQSAAPDRYDP